MAQPIAYALSMYGNPYTNALSIMEKQKAMRLASNEMGKTLASKRVYKNASKQRPKAKDTKNKDRTFK